MDLSMEATILENPAFHGLFTEEEIAVCRRRLTDCGYMPRSSSEGARTGYARHTARSGILRGERTPGHLRI